MPLQLKLVCQSPHCRLPRLLRNYRRPPTRQARPHPSPPNLSSRVLQFLALRLRPLATNPCHPSIRTLAHNPRAHLPLATNPRRPSIRTLARNPKAHLPLATNPCRPPIRMLARNPRAHLPLATNPCHLPIPMRQCHSTRTPHRLRLGTLRTSPSARPRVPLSAYCSDRPHTGSNWVSRLRTPG